MASTFASHENGFPQVGNLIHDPHASITEIMGNGFFILDQKWTVSSWNYMAEKLLGISTTDILGKNLWTQFKDEIPEAFYNAYYKAMLKDIPTHFVLFWAKRKTWYDVTTYHFDDSLSVSFNSIRNSEDPFLSRQQLKSLNDIYRLITEVTTDCLWEWDLGSEQIFWIDGGHKRVFGYEIENALIPQRFWEVRLHPDDKLRILTSIRNFFTEGNAFDWEEEYRFQKFNGEYAHVHDRGHLVYSRGKRTSRMIGATQDITARKSAESQLLKSERNLALQQLKNQKERIAAVLNAQEKERADIGKELHDNLNQILGASKLYIELAKTDVENRDMLLQKSAEYVATVIEEIRNISKNLAAPRLNVMGLAENIKILAEDIMRINCIHIQFQEEDFLLEKLNETLQLDIFRIVQEQLNNILKHAEASRAEIHLARKSNSIELMISDNGIGCDNTAKSKGVGIMNITSRADLYQGKVSILSHPGEGYVLNVSFSDPA